MKKQTIAQLLGGVALTALIMVAGKVHAKEQASCQNLRASDVGWADNTAINALAFTVLEPLGYKVDVKILSTPVTAKSLSTGDIDLFLDQWSPASLGIYEPYFKAKTIEVVRTNLKGAKYTFATTKKAYDEGLKHIKDLPKFKDKLGGKVYGIEPGNEGNEHFRRAFAKYGVEGFTVVESSEAGMLTQVDRNKDGYVVFLGWAPHWMGFLYQMEYLDGGDEWFGKNGGAATIQTVVRKDFKKDCPNVYTFLKNVEFTLAMENEVMFKIGKEKQQPKTAAIQYLKKNPEVVDKWLKKVKTYDGRPALPVAKSALGL